ncbi:MAG: hypothetical protein ACUVTM_05825 [Candidatus Bathyarchaeia archaeon]
MRDRETLWQAFKIDWVKASGKGGWFVKVHMDYIKAAVKGNFCG